MSFRPCIDLHEGKVKQIVGSTLTDGGQVTTNFVSEKSPGYYADLYYKDGLKGGHVIMLGPGNERAAEEAVARHPGNLQVGGGVTPENGCRWLERGAGQVIVTSWLFPDYELDMARVRKMSHTVTAEKLVIDLSCVKMDGVYRVACNRWQNVCKAVLDRKLLMDLSEFCCEFLVHAVSVEGKKGGIDRELVEKLAEESPIPVTYAGGIRHLQDVKEVQEAGKHRVNYTIGSALDIFGGTLSYQEIVASEKNNFLT